MIAISKIFERQKCWALLRPIQTFKKSFSVGGRIHRWSYPRRSSDPVITEIPPKTVQLRKNQTRQALAPLPTLLSRILRIKEKITFSETAPDTSETFWLATSVNFQPTSATLPLIFEAPKESADQLWKNGSLAWKKNPPTFLFVKF